MLPSIRVASVPAAHIYVRRLAHPCVMRLADPRPERASAVEQWWPPVMLVPGWVEDHADQFDLLHLHFGFDACGPAILTELVAALRRCGKPLVYTVHDLVNPHHDEPGMHRAALDVLIPAADALITLTAGAAERIEREWGRQVTVLPHPHVVDLARMARPRPYRSGTRLGLHLKSLRAGMNPLPVLESFADEVARRPGFELRVDVHTDVMTAGMPRHAPHVAEILRAGESKGRFDLRVHDFFDDDAFLDYLQDLDASVLPYRHGTHSGWLEACYDLGTKVIAPSIGYYQDQHAGVIAYSITNEQVDTPGVAAALDELSRSGAWQADPAQRALERANVASAHYGLYARLLGRV